MGEHYPLALDLGYQERVGIEEMVERGSVPKFAYGVLVFEAPICATF